MATGVPSGIVPKGAHVMPVEKVFEFDITLLIKASRAKVKRPGPLAKPKGRISFSGAATEGWDRQRVTVTVGIHIHGQSGRHF